MGCPSSFFSRKDINYKNQCIAKVAFSVPVSALRGPISTFKTLDNGLSKCIWQNKRPRIRLQSPKEKSGLNLPNMKKYYWAAQLDH